MKKFLFLLSALVLPFLSIAADKVCWDFTHPQGNKDYPVTVRGESRIADGALQVLDSSGKIGGAAMNKIYPEVAPDKAFRLTVEFTLDSKFQRKNLPAMLWDSKYVTNPNQTPQHKSYHRGFQFFLAPGNGGNFRIKAAFGFGNSSQVVQGALLSIYPDVKHVITMEFNASDRVSFTFDGAPAGVCILKPGFLAEPYRIPILGDRQSSNFWPLGGKIHKVTMEKLAWKPIQLSKNPVDRRVFLWKENNAAMKIAVSNFSEENIKDLTLSASTEYGKIEIPVPVAEAGKLTVVPVPVNTLLLPGEYQFALELKDAQKNVVTSGKESFVIAPVAGDYMPVMLWGGMSIAKAAYIGFTHMGLSLVPYDGRLDASNYAAYINWLDEYFKNGIRSYSPITLDRRFTKVGRFLRTGRNNTKLVPASVDPSREELQKEILYHVGESAINMGSHPGWDMALSISEERDRTNVDFSGRMNEAFRKFSGYDIPASVAGKYPTPRRANLVAENRILPDDDKELTFYRWFWTRGDGWNDLHSKITAKIHEHIKRDFTTFHDPAVRVPLIWGSGGKVDAIAHWTYTNPDPIKIAQTTDELIAMADGCEGQKVMSMTQAIWYRSAAAPGSNVKNPPEWLAREPKAVYMTLPPDALRISFWSKISRKIAGIQYHGANSLAGEDSNSSYRYTNSEAQEALRDVLYNVLKPLGPVLKKADEQPMEVAILETFPATLYTQHHFPVGWSRNWVADLHLALQWAHIQAGILFDDHLLNNKKLDRLKVLFIPGAEVMTRSVVDKVKELQRKGVIIVGDEFTPPEVQVDLRINSIIRDDRDPQKSKEVFQKLGKEISDALKGYYQSRYSAADQDIVLRTRQAGDGEYLFVINDKRTFGDYIGQWKRVMEKGLPNKTTIKIKSNAVAAYDAVAHKAIPAKRADDSLVFETALPGGGGQLVILLPEAIGEVKAGVSVAEVKKGQAFQLNASICNQDGKVISALLPVEVVLKDAAGNKLPGSGYYAAENGQLTINENIAVNAASGKVSVEVRCLASGKVGKAEFTIL